MRITLPFDGKNPKVIKRIDYALKIGAVAFLTWLGFHAVKSVYTFSEIAYYSTKKIPCIEESAIKDVRVVNSDGQSLDDVIKNCAALTNEPDNFLMGKCVLIKYILDKLMYSDLINLVKTPKQAYDLIVVYSVRNGTSANLNNPSFKQIHEKKEKLDCSESALIAASTLYDNGYRPLMLGMITKSGVFSNRFINFNFLNFFNKDAGQGHAVFLYKQDGKFGYVGNDEFSYKKFDSVSDIVKHLSEKGETKYTHYSIFDLSEADKDWLTKPIKYHIPRCTFVDVK